MLKRFLASLACVAVLAGTAMASDARPAVGEDAPELGRPNWLFNAPEGDISFKDLRGEVILIERWGVRCPPCIAYLPQLQQTWNQYRGKGLHVFTFEVQGTAEEHIADVVRRMNLTFPVATGGPGGYSARGIPSAWLIGVDGKVIFQGNPRNGLAAVLREEMNKVRFPGLGLSEVHRDVAPAAQQFVNGQYGRARSQAQRIIERGERSEAQAREHAQHIVDRINGMVSERFERAEAHEEARRYLDAYEIYEWMVANFRREEEGTRATERMREMDRDRDIQREMDADKALRRIQGQIGDNPTPESLRQSLPALRQFVDRFEGTRAAEDVQRLLEQAR